MKADVINFLRTDPAVAKINFDFHGLKVWPGAYGDVAACLDRKEIALIIDTGIAAGVWASYDLNFDTLSLPPIFDITNVDHQSYLVHECTHAHHDRLSMGSIATPTFESCGYLAEAAFREINGRGSLGAVPAERKIRDEAHRIAKKTVVTGKYTVEAADVGALEAILKLSPHYSKMPPMMLSSGMTRGITADFLRTRFLTKGSKVE